MDTVLTVLTFPGSKALLVFVALAVWRRDVRVWRTLRTVHWKDYLIGWASGAVAVWAFIH